MAWVFKDKSPGNTGNELSSSVPAAVSASDFLESSRRVDAPAEHEDLYERSLQGNIKHIHASVGGQNVGTTGNPTFANITVTNQLNAGSIIVDATGQPNYSSSIGNGLSVFGDTIDDVHSVTGSFNVSGSLEVQTLMDLSGSSHYSMSAEYFEGKGTSLANAKIDNADHVPVDVFEDTTSALQLPTGSRPTQPPGQRGIMVGGDQGPSNVSDQIQFVTISTPSNATDFGNLSAEKKDQGAASNGVNDRGITFGGLAITDVIEFNTISTPSDAIDFGNMFEFLHGVGGTSNGPNERALLIGGNGQGQKNTIEFVTISTTGNANDFGDTVDPRHLVGATSNGVNDRAVYVGNSPVSTDIEFVTISTTGNAAKFGDTTANFDGPRGSSNDLNDRAVFNNAATIEFLAISHEGNTLDFGDRTVAAKLPSGFSNGTDERGMFAGGTVAPLNDTIDYVTISTPGNAIDFGNMLSATAAGYGYSNSPTQNWPYENSLDSITLFTSGSASSYSSITGSYLHISASTHGQSGGVYSGSSATLLETIESGSLTVSSNTPPGNTSVHFMGSGTNNTSIETVRINTPGDATDFGGVQLHRGYQNAGLSNGILQRGIFVGGMYNDDVLNKQIQYITISTPGNANSFGEAGGPVNQAGGLSNGPGQRGVYTRTLNPGQSNGLEYLTISTLGNGFDFGDQTMERTLVSGLSNGVHDRGVFAGDKPFVSGQMDFITISTPSNASIFGNLRLQMNKPAAFSNDTNGRGILASGGGLNSGIINTIEHIAISTLGDTAEFGHLQTGANDGATGASNGRGERGIAFDMRTSNPVGHLPLIETITIDRPSDAVTFGNCVDTTPNVSSATSDGATFYPQAAYPSMRFSVDLAHMKANASGSANFQSGGLFTIPIITSASTAQSGSNSFVRGAEGATGRTGIFEAWTGLVPQKVNVPSGSSPQFLSFQARSGSSAQNASMSIASTFNVSASFTSGSAVSASTVAATQVFGTNTIYTGEWKTITSGSIVPGQRAVVGNGGSISIDYATISTLGNAIDFGDGVASLDYSRGLSNGVRDRGLIAGGKITGGADRTTIDFITINTPANAIAGYGDIQHGDGSKGGSLSNGPDDRGLLFSNETATGKIEFLSLVSPGDATDFGNMVHGVRDEFQHMSNGVGNRGAYTGGGPAAQTGIEFVTISSIGDATTFGDTTVARADQHDGGGSNDQNNRGIFAGGSDNVTIDFITLTSIGNAIDFGDLAMDGDDSYNWMATNGVGERALVGADDVNEIAFITINTAGNSTNFGDLNSTNDDGKFALSNGATHPAEPGSTLSVERTFTSSSIAFGSGSTIFNASSSLDINGFTGQLSQSNFATGSSIALTSRIMNTTGSGQVSASISAGALIDFSPKTLPGERGLLVSSDSPGNDTIGFITISTLGNAALFGEVSVAAVLKPGGSNGTGGRFVKGIGGASGDGNLSNEFFTISTCGNAVHFGYATHDRQYNSAATNGTDQRLVVCATRNNENVEFLTISTLGNSLLSGFDTSIFTPSKSTNGVDQGGATSNGRNGRAVWTSQLNGGTDAVHTMFYMSILSGGDSKTFGTLTGAPNFSGALSNDVDDRAVFHHQNSNIMDYITISTPMNAVDFGDNTGNGGSCVGVSNGINQRGIVYQHDTLIINYITVSTPSNAVEFGEQLAAVGVSDQFGGQGGTDSAL